MLPHTSLIGFLALRLIAPITLINLALIAIVLVYPPFGRRGIWEGLNQLHITTCEHCGQDCRGCRGLTCPECGGMITHPDGSEETLLEDPSP